jgi:hypothetical protein
MNFYLKMLPKRTKKVTNRLKHYLMKSFVPAKVCVYILKGRHHERSIKPVSAFSHGSDLTA